jgi:hypothetical protein
MLREALAERQILTAPKSAFLLKNTQKSNDVRGVEIGLKRAFLVLKYVK